MRIEGPKAADSVRKNEKARKTGAASSDFKSFLEADAGSAAETSSAPMVADVGALILAQAVEDPMEGKTKKRMRERAEKVLEALDSVQRGLVSGTLTTNQMEDVTRALASRREKINDPRLNDVLDHVDLRAQVELAKMEMAKEKQ